jgi:hypothetical protein
MGEDWETDDEVIYNLEHGRSKWRTICQVHREIYRKISNDKDLVSLLIEAHRKAKRMDMKLKWYKKMYVDDREGMVEP